jgi:hypothetical protein
MAWKAWLGFGLAMMALAPVARAGYVLPTWVETVEVQATLDPSTGRLVTSFDQYPGAVSGFDLYFSEDRYSGEYVSYETLIDYQDVTGPITIDVTSASLGGYLSGFTVPLFVSSFPASPQPPVLGSAPQGGSEIDIPTGDYSSAPLSLTLTPDAQGSVCFLLSTGTTDIYGPSPSVISVETVAAMAMAPEPSSIAMLPIGIGFVLACLARRKKKRPGPRGLAGR